MLEIEELEPRCVPSMWFNTTGWYADYPPPPQAGVVAWQDSTIIPVFPPGAKGGSLPPPKLVLTVPPENAIIVDAGTHGGFHDWSAYYQAGGIELSNWESGPNSWNVPAPSPITPIVPGIDLSGGGTLTLGGPLTLEFQQPDGSIVTMPGGYSWTTN